MSVPIFSPKDPGAELDWHCVEHPVYAEVAPVYVHRHIHATREAKTAKAFIHGHPHPCCPANPLAAQPHSHDDLNFPPPAPAPGAAMSTCTHPKVQTADVVVETEANGFSLDLKLNCSDCAEPRETYAQGVTSKPLSRDPEGRPVGWSSIVSFSTEAKV